MEDKIVLYSLFFLLSALALKLLHRTRSRHKNLPPSPFALPIIGHLHLLKEPLHQSLFPLSQKYGPIFSLRLGSRLAVVVSSPSAVEECFTKNDINFANRPLFWASKYIGYNSTTVGLAPYGDHWRNLRRIFRHEILSPNCLKLSSAIRVDETMILLKKLYNVSSHDFVKVKLKPMLSEFTFNMIMRMIAGKQFKIGNEVTEKLEGKRLQKLMEDLFQMGVSGNIGDFFPFLQWTDFQGYKKNVIRLFKETDEFLQELIDELRRNKGDFEWDPNTMISHLLSLQESQPEYYSDEIIKGLMVDMLNASMDTIVAAVEWSMSNLLNNPNELAKTRAELDFVVGQDKLLDEIDLRKLTYLQNVVSETLRVNTIAPLLIPHMSSDHCTLGGYHIPKNTMLLINAWAIHRDPKLWDEPTSFKPERFGNGEINHEATYKLMPFGLGRRSCPGKDLAPRAVSLVLGSLIQCFEWKRVGEKEVDMTEGKGVTMPKAEPLVVLCKARNIANKLMS
ncbi:hypothetical protein REPUB_Repub13aG0087700 [Reevesia pubescens]